MNMRLPDLITLYTETEKRAFTGAEGGFNDVRYTLTETAEGLEVRVSADETPLTYLRLRWHFGITEKRCEPLRIYGDA